ncbi:MAG TPA: acyl-CoA dehydrogenase family protein [Bryobacteraceae bacterium]|jgi:alkylation response protein AidB-like acyl-CoA dehydrogenase|nr:acyl-CoA dehydrogenase family protein [Bryobacteraceae bacterium]
MDFAFTPKQSEYRAYVRSWIAGALPRFLEQFPDPTARSETDLNLAWDKALYEGGLSCVNWPVEFGGQGLSLIERFILAEELGRAYAPEGANISGVDVVAPMLLAEGTEEQRGRFLPRIAAVEDIWCQGFSEPNAGSDLLSLKTSARREGEEWVINGQKIWTTNAHYADYCLLLARTDPEARPRSAMSLLIVPMGAPGVVVKPLIHLTGRSDFNEIFFEDVKVPFESRLGPVNNGWPIASATLANERGTARLYRHARYVREFNDLLGLATQNGSFSKSGYVRSRFAELFARLSICRQHNMKIISRMAQGLDLGVGPNIVKVFWSELHQDLASFALEIMGAHAAVVTELDVNKPIFQNIYLHSRAETIYSGTSQIQRNIIAERGLGLPR